jgi:hypothetical protein
MKAVALIAVCVVLAACMPAVDPQPTSVQDVPQPVTVGIQCGSYWKGSPHMRAFYDETVATFANGTDVDVDAYEARVFAIFRQFVRANHLGDEKIVEQWWGLIPRQMVGIVQEDPTVLESYNAFWIAYAGPD